MKTYILIFLSILIVTVCKGQITVTFDIEGGRPSTELTLQTPDSSFLLPFDSAGRVHCNLILDKKHFGYGRLIYGFGQVYLFFYKDFNCSITLKSSKMEATFSGNGKQLNEYVSAFNTISADTYKLKEEEFLKIINERYVNSLKTLENIGFPEEFKKIEQIRQKLFDAYVVYNYPSIHASQTKQPTVSLSPAYYELLESYLIDDPDVLQNGQSQSRLLETTQKTATIKHSNFKTPEEELEIKVNFVLEKFTDPAIRSYLVQRLISAYTGRYGVDQLGKLKDTFDEVVTDTEAKRKLNILYTQTKRIHPGAPSPEFSYKDINDNIVSLNSFRGKYVYIDVWATWCGPCCKEIPHLVELEHKFKNKNIHFVSISIDKSHKTWQKMIQEKNMQGIQLHSGNDQSFSESYMIASIPRFILLDPDGRIINAKMSAPSNPKTIQTLNELKDL